MILKTLEIRFSLPSTVKLNQAIGSIMQGVLMERIDRDYATYLHKQNLRPYSQYIFFSKKDNCLIWRISALNQQAADEILLPLFNLPYSIFLRHKQTRLTTLNKEYIYENTYENLAQKYLSLPNNPDKQKIIDFNFITSTAFKSQGKYIIFPKIHLVLASLLNRWNAFSQTDFINDKQITSGLQRYLYVADYKLNMRPFSLEGIRVPAFVGTYSVGVVQNDMAQKILAMLSEFAQLSGIGIKTAIGMGAVRTQIHSA